MALRDLLKLIDSKLSDTFNQKSFDPAKARAPLLKHIEVTKRQFASTEPVRGRKAFKVSNSVVEYRPPVPIEGHSTCYIPSERFDDFLNALKTTVEAGELDKALAEPVAPTAQLQTTRGGAGKKRAGWSPERREKQAAAIAARKAAKGS